jgi:hypothetical protein
MNRTELETVSMDIFEGEGERLELTLCRSQGNQRIRLA